MHYIGGRDDTNANLTRRVLLLLESRPIGRREAYDRVLRAILDRYLSGDHGWIHDRSPFGVPRFLHNDISRYWRTVTVDFAYKQWSRRNEGWALRSAKLRMSRKLTYAAGLLYCFALANNDASPTSADPDPKRKLEAIELLGNLTASTPLDLLATAFMTSPSLRPAANQALSAYDEFIAILDDPADRDHLKTLPPDRGDADSRYQRVRAIGREFQAGLNVLFFDDTSTSFPIWTREYGVF